jgi:hypothetical protein
MVLAVARVQVVYFFCASEGWANGLLFEHFGLFRPGRHRSPWFL